MWCKIYQPINLQMEAHMSWLAKPWTPNLLKTMQRLVALSQPTVFTFTVNITPPPTPQTPNPLLLCYSWSAAATANTLPLVTNFPSLFIGQIQTLSMAIKIFKRQNTAKNHFPSFAFFKKCFNPLAEMWQNCQFSLFPVTFQNFCLCQNAAENDLKKNLVQVRMFMTRDKIFNYFASFQHISKTGWIQQIMHEQERMDWSQR